MQDPARNLERDADAISQALLQVAQAFAQLAHAIKGQPIPHQPAPAAPDLVPTAPNVLQIPRPTDNSTVLELVNEFLKARARLGRSDRYLRALRVSLVAFSRGRKHVQADKVTVEEIERWLSENKWAPRTQAGYLADVRTMFNYGLKRGLCSVNPAAAVELPTVDQDTPPGIHTPEQVRTVLEFARGYDLAICRALAIRYFAGLRSSEMNQIQEGNIGQAFIEVPSSIAKTRRRRPIQIRANLRAWLDATSAGELPVKDWNNQSRWFTAALLKKHKIPWPHNVTRHSFVSYALADCQSAARVALEAGNTEQMIFAHYRELVTPAAAVAFWSIRPAEEPPGGTS
jgi:integrase